MYERIRKEYVECLYIVTCVKTDVGHECVRAYCSSDGMGCCTHLRFPAFLIRTTFTFSSVSRGPLLLIRRLYRQCTIAVAVTIASICIRSCFWWLEKGNTGSGGGGASTSNQDMPYAHQIAGLNAHQIAGLNALLFS